MFDRETGKSRGFAFAEIDNGVLAELIGNCNGAELDGRKLAISEARPRR
jgi:cold-inducible RNA-binding protein